MAPRYYCECCCEDFNDYTSIAIDDSIVCPGCIRGMFDKALKFEHEYPPRWSGHIHPSEFSHIFSADYIERYKHKEIEYKTPPSKRVYCQYQIERPIKSEGGDDVMMKEVCGGFVGVRQKANKPDILTLGRCRECKSASCMVCDDVPSEPTSILQHVCAGKSFANEKRAQAFVGLKRGKDWQLCPSRQCGRRIELSEACNHITCNCGMGFCFICGKEAEGDSEHWASPKSGCPRYNHPDDSNAEYDESSEYDEDEPAPSRDEVEEDSDPLDNVRNLFAADGDDVATIAATSDNTESSASAVAVDGQNFPRRITIVPWLDNEVSADASSQGELELLFAENEEEGRAAHNSEAKPMSSQDAEAIASAFWEDDWNDDGHYTYEILGDGDELVVTLEEEDIDRALWRMRIE